MSDVLTYVEKLMTKLGLPFGGEVHDQVQHLVVQSVDNPEAKKVLDFLEESTMGDHWKPISIAFAVLYKTSEQLTDAEQFIQAVIKEAGVDINSDEENPIHKLKEIEIRLPAVGRADARTHPALHDTIIPEEKDVSSVLSEIIQLCDLDTDNQDSIEKLTALIKSSKTNPHARKVLMYLGKKDKPEAHTQAAIRFFNRYETDVEITNSEQFIHSVASEKLTVMETRDIDQQSVEMTLAMYRMHAIPDNAVFIDCESCSLEVHAAVMSVAAVPFVLNSSLSVMKTLEDKNWFYRNLDLTEQFFAGCHFDPKTQREFWSKPELTDARKELLVDRQSVVTSLLELMDFIKPIIKNGGLVFFRNPKADWMWIDNLCTKFGVRNPVKYNRAHNLSTWLTARLGYECTFYNIPQVHQHKLDKHFGPHHALHDAARDAFQIANVNKDTGFEIRPKP